METILHISVSILFLDDEGKVQVITIKALKFVSLNSWDEFSKLTWMRTMQLASASQFYVNVLLFGAIPKQRTQAAEIQMGKNMLHPKTGGP